MCALGNLGIIFLHGGEDHRVDLSKLAHHTHVLECLSQNGYGSLRKRSLTSIGRFQNHRYHLDVYPNCFERLVQLPKVTFELPVVVHELFLCGRDVLLAFTILA